MSAQERAREVALSRVAALAGGGPLDLYLKERYVQVLSPQEREEGDEPAEGVE